MIGRAKRRITKMFREFLVYHSDSLEFRAKILTLAMASDNEYLPCKAKTLTKVSQMTYPNDHNRAELLVETVNEYLDTIYQDNGLDYEHLILSVEKEIKESKRFADKIDIAMLELFQVCIEDDDNKRYQQKILDFLERLKKGI
jgi:hypothetical protein